MYGLVESHGSRADWAERLTRRTRKRAGIPEKGSWAAVCVAIALVAGLVTLAVFAVYDVNQEQPSDEELTTNFFAHEPIFDELAQMPAAGHPNPAKGALLRQISVANLRYFPDSGKLVLVPDREENPERPSKSYLYLPHARPQALVQYHGYNWRGPGIYILTGDRPLKGFWFIHHETSMEVAVAPY